MEPFNHSQNDPFHLPDPLLTSPNPSKSSINNPANPSIDSYSPALFAKLVTENDKKDLSVDDQAFSVSDATTMTDSKLLMSQLDSQLCPLDNNNHQSPNHHEGRDNQAGSNLFGHSSTSLDEMKTSCEEGEEKGKKEEQQKDLRSEEKSTEAETSPDHGKKTEGNLKEETVGSEPNVEPNLKLTLEKTDSFNQETSEPHSLGEQKDSKTGGSLSDVFTPCSRVEQEKEKKVVKPEVAVKKPKISPADFQKVTLLGRGSYAEVHLVQRIPSNNKLYALKTIDKYFMKKEKKEHQVYVEKEVLMRSNHPNIIKFYSSFQDKKKLYFVLEYVGGGEFSNYLRIQRKLSKDQIVFFAAEIINILETLHSMGIAHRDVKPENLMLTNDGHLKCIDFGTAKFLNSEKSDTEMFPVKKHADDDDSGQKSDLIFVGTAQYVSPEMLETNECGASGDLWALGCIIYQMALGKYPFDGANEYLIFEKIKNFDITYPEGMDLEIKDLVQKLIVKDPQTRLGAGAKGSENDYSALKGHALFNGVDFAMLHKQKAPLVEIVSPYKLKNPYFQDGPSQKSQPARKHFLSDDLQNLEKETNTTPKSVQENVQENAQEEVSTSEEKHEQAEMSGMVSKKCGWLFFRPRFMSLKKNGELIYYDPDNQQQKGEIILDETANAKLETKTSWVINTQKKKFYFKEIEHESTEKWVKAINTAVETLKPNDQQNKISEA